MDRKLQKFFQEADGVLLTSPHNLRYFTGFCGGEGIALVINDSKYLFVDARYTVAAKQEAPAFEVVEFGAGKRNAEIGERLSGIKTLVFEDEFLTVQEFQRFQKAWDSIVWLGRSQELEELRMIKTEAELQWLRQAEQIGVLSFEQTLSMIKPGVREIEVAAELEYQMRKEGAEGTSFETIVVSGVKSSMPHGKPDQKKIAPGDFVTMDFGCRFGGYCSDMTRTVVVGSASPEQKKIYDTVRLAQEAGLEAIGPGVTGAQADLAARAVIEEAGYGKYFGHALGHGVGLLIHELPRLSPASDVVLEPGMVVSCEPGIYVPGFGGVRIEDLVCVTSGGMENLTHLSKELLEL